MYNLFIHSDRPYPCYILPASSHPDVLIHPFLIESIQNEGDGTSAEGEQEYTSVPSSDNASTDEMNMQMDHPATALKKKSSEVTSTSNVPPTAVTQVSHRKSKYQDSPYAHYW